MFKKVKDVVMTLGRSIKETLIQGVSKVKALIAKPAIEGEYIAKGAVDHSRRAFFTKSALTTAFTVCLFILPSVSFAAVDVAITTALTDALADVGTVGAAVFTVIVAAAVFKYLRRVL